MPTQILPSRTDPRIVSLSPAATLNPSETSTLLHPPADVAVPLVFVTAVAGVVVALHAGAIVPFLIVSAAAGIAQGAANSAGMRSVFDRVERGDRAGTLALLYLISYGGAAVPGLIAGPLSRTVSLPDVGSGYAVLVAAAAAAAIVFSLLRSRRAAQPGS